MLLATVMIAALVSSPQPALTRAQIAAIDAAAEKSLKLRHVPSVVVAIDRDGKRIFTSAYGYRNVADKLSADTHTLYQYGSITKQFTAMAIFLLAQDGRLDLHADVGTWFPAFAGHGITIEDLLVHTSGIPDLINNEAFANYAALPFLTADDLIAWAAEHPYEFPVGTRAQYSNTGYLMLGRIVEKISGETLDAFFARRLFRPAGMKTAHGYQMLRILPNLALGYMLWDTDFAKLDPHGSQGAVPGRLVNAMPWNMRNAAGAGYLVGDAGDLQAWDEALLSGTLLHGKWRDLYFSPGKLANGQTAYAGAENPGKVRPAYCYGGLATVADAGHTMFLANGGTAGFLTFTAIVPDMHLAVTTLTNLGQVNNADLTTPIVDALLRAK
jgi:CubicO group peptidase (beta-lactamase class C family)